LNFYNIMVETAKEPQKATNLESADVWEDEPDPMDELNRMTDADLQRAISDIES